MHGFKPLDFPWVPLPEPRLILCDRSQCRSPAVGSRCPS